MKVIKGFKLANVVLVSAMALALSGCGDDPLNSTTTTKTTSFSGKTADGYLTNATVCLDLNKDKVCGINEPTAMSTAGGAFTIAGATQSQIDENPLLVEITANTIDEDYPGQILRPYTLSAPPGFTFVSPLTTMIQNIIEQDGSTAGAAEEAVKALLGTTLDLSTDYIAGKNDSANQAEFEKLHKVAQVVARISAAKVEESTDQVAANDFTVKDLSTAIMKQVFAQLDNITAQVETAMTNGGEFDPDTIATEISDLIVIDIIETEPVLDDYVLISSTGAASEINTNTVVGEWSTGSVINAAGNYEGLNAWTITSGGSWGTVLALTGGFVGDLSEFDLLKLKIATLGGYADGYFIKISANGVESADIALSVDDEVRGWQDVEVDLANYDLSSIEYITVFAKEGTAGVSQIHIADLALGQQPAAVPETVIQEYALISSAGTASEITEDTAVGEWSTGSVIDAAGFYEGLNAWTMTSGSSTPEGGNWGTVLALTGGFVGDFSAFDKLKLKIATSGGYVDGYFIKISAGGVETEIPLTVTDESRSWQNVEVDLAAYDLSSIEYIAVFAKTGTAGVSQIHIADLSLVQLADTDTDTGTDSGTGTDTVQAALEVQKTAAALVNASSSYTTSTWATLTTALAMPETTPAEVTAKTAAITTAIVGLAEKTPVDPVDPGLEEGPNLVVNGDFDNSTLANNESSVGEWNYYTVTDTVVAIADSKMTAVVTSVGGGQWDNQIWNQVQVTEEGDYVVKLTASSTVDRDILIRVDAIGMNGDGTTSAASDVIAQLTSTPQVFTLYVSGSAFTADAAFKIVTSLGVLEAANTTSVASTVTFDDVYLGTLAQAVLADKTDLETAIATAQVRHDGGADETLKTVFQAAIDAAQAVVDDAEATQTEADDALAALATVSGEFDPNLVPVEGNLVINGNFADAIVVNNANTIGEWNYYSTTGTVVAIANQVLTAEVTNVGGQWDNQIWNEVQVTQAGNYVLRFTASSTVDRDMLIRVDGIEMNGDGTLSAASDIIANLTSTPQTFTRYFSGSQFAGNPRFKVVTSVGGLEAGGTTSVPSTVTYHDVYLGVHAGDVPTDTATLSSAITVATNVFNAAVEGGETGQYTTSKADLQTAINDAQSILDSADPTQDQTDAGVAALAAARTTFEAGLVVEAIPGAQIATSAGNINYTPDTWGTGTTLDLAYTGDATYSSTIQLVGTGSWGTVLAMTGITQGTLANYTNIDFKVKTTDFTELKVKVPEVEKGYALSTGIDLGNGWVQMSIPMSDFAQAPVTAEQFAIFGPGGTGTILLTDISFSNNL
jgi:hypothetical protein